jgi:hypothetical protein
LDGGNRRLKTATGLLPGRVRDWVRMASKVTARMVMFPLSWAFLKKAAAKMDMEAMAMPARIWYTTTIPALVLVNTPRLMIKAPITQPGRYIIVKEA